MSPWVHLFLVPEMMAFVLSAVPSCPSPVQKLSGDQTHVRAAADLISSSALIAAIALCEGKVQGVGGNPVCRDNSLIPRKGEY